MECWICGDEATTREHRSKKSDLKNEVGQISQNKPLYLHESHNNLDKRNARKKNIIVRSLNSNILKYQHKICNNCNSMVTKPYDLAWQGFVKKLKSLMQASPKKQKIVRCDEIFPSNTSLNMLHVHLYFVKFFGCLIRESHIRLKNPIPIDLQTFSHSILSQEFHQNIYLSFNFQKQENFIVKSTDVYADKNTSNQISFAKIIYSLGNLSVSLMYALPNEKREELKFAWHPRQGSDFLLFNTAINDPF